MSELWRAVILKGVVPGAAGALVAAAIFPGGTSMSAPVAAGDPARRPAAAVEAPLPGSDPALIKLAALAGRTTEARQQALAALKAGESDKAVAEWLVPILVADPAWLESFLTGVPEERRAGLIRAVFLQMAESQPDAVWELVRRSPAARLAAETKVPGERYPRLEILEGGAWNSALAAEVLFDPAMGFSEQEIDRLCRHSLYHPDSSRRILEEWQGGRWKGQDPDWVRTAWFLLKAKDPAALKTMEASLPAELQEKTRSFAAYGELFHPGDPAAALPGAEQLAILKPAELADYCKEQAMAGKPVPLETLLQLPEETRGKAMGSYVEWLYPFSVDTVHSAIGRLDELKLSPSEKQSLLYEAGCAECNELKDYDTAMQWFARIPDEKLRASSRSEAITELFSIDPEKALGFIREMPAGPEREKLEAAALDALP